MTVATPVRVWYIARMRIFPLFCTVLSSINNIALILGIAQGLFLAALLRQRHWKLYANRFLAALMAAYALILLNLLAQDLGFHALHPKLWLLLSGLPLLSGPLHYLYARHLIHPDRRFGRREWLHFLPFILYKLTELPLLFGDPDALAFILRDVTAHDMPWRFFLFNWAIIAQSLLYLGGTLIMLQRHARGLEDVVSSAHHLRLTWLRNITLLSLVAWLLFTIEFSFFLGGMTLADRFGVTGILGGVLVYVMGYLGLARSEILEAHGIAASLQDLSQYRKVQQQAGAPRVSVGMDRPKSSPSYSYSKSGLSDEAAASIEHRLRAALEEKHVYRDSALTLPKLAEQLDVSPHNLSEVINTRVGMNFFDLVNGYRVREVQRRLEDPAGRQFTVLAIAFDAGFNSKTSFNTIFKKQTGMTPSAYRESRGAAV